MSAGTIRSAAATHAGAVRSHNEDAVLDRPDLGLWAVADGAGGHDCGEVASGMIAAALERIPPGLSAAELLSEVRRCIGDTHAALREMAEARGRGAIIASTVVVLIVRGTHFACLWAGDSRAYLLRGGALSQLTRDHSLVQELVEAGAITAAQAEGHPRANVITRAVGAESDGLELDKVSGRLLPGDRLLLCSDGVCKTLNDAELTGVLAAAEPPAEALIAMALARNVTDNVSAVIVDFMPGDIMNEDGGDPERTLRRS